MINDKWEFGMLFVGGLLKEGMKNGSCDKVATSRTEGEL